MTTTDETTTRAELPPAPPLRERNGMGTYSAFAYLDGKPHEWPRCPSDQGTTMAVEWVRVTWQESLSGGGEWELEKVEAEGRYVHDALGVEPMVTALTQQATWSPTAPLPTWLTALVRELRPAGPPPGHDLSEAQRAALALAELPVDAVQLLHTASRYALQMLDDLGGDDRKPLRDHLARARRVVLDLAAKLRHQERFAYLDDERGRRGA